MQRSDPDDLVGLVWTDFENDEILRKTASI